MQTFLILYIVFGILLGLLSLPLMAGKIPPNPLYGFRVPATLNEREIWYPANRFAAKRLAAAAVSLLLAAIVLYFIPGINLDGYTLGCLLVFTSVFIIGLLQSFQYLRMIRKENE